MRKKVIGNLREYAADNYGYFTIRQATSLGASNQALNSLLNSRAIERVSRGVYRVASQPVSPLDPYQAAALWPNGEGVLSHETVLELLELSDVNPTKVNITVPSTFKTTRKVPPSYSLHHSDLTPKEVTYHEGIPITCASRAISDCHEEHLGAELLLQAVKEGYRRGYLSRQEAQVLEKTVAV